MIKYKTLSDFLISNSLNVDVCLDDGWGGFFPLKGIEIEATILFADISEFSKRTFNLNPTETLIFINTFFSWISYEALLKSSGIIDKYIGDEIMIVFSNEFGSKNHFVEAIQTARRISEKDFHNFNPHIGIAGGKVIIGYVGTPLQYNCSVFGKPVTIAARCASVSNGSSSIIFPSNLWKDYKIDKIIVPTKHENDTNNKKWELLPKRKEKFRNIPPLEILELVNNCSYCPKQTMEERSRESFKNIKNEKL